MFLTQIINGEVTELAFCEECAKARGLFDPQALSFAEKFFPEKFQERVGNLLKELNIGASPSRQHGDADSKGNLLTECPVCHFTLDDYRRSEHLGCPDCYRVFAREIFSDAETQEAGSEEPAPNGASPALTRKQIEAELSLAIEREDYETAARLRDQLKNLD